MMLDANGSHGSPTGLCEEGFGSRRQARVFWVGLVMGLLTGFALITQLAWTFDGQSWDILTGRAQRSSRFQRALLVADDGREVAVTDSVAARVTAGQRVCKSGRSCFVTVDGRRVLAVNLWSVAGFVGGLLMIGIGWFGGAAMRTTLAGLGSENVFWGLLATALVVALIGFDLA